MTGKKNQEGQRGVEKATHTLLPQKKGTMTLIQLEIKLRKSKDYGIDCLTLLPTLTCLPLAISYRDCTIKHEQGWRVGMQNHERPTQPKIFNYTLYLWFAKRNFLGVLTTLGFAKPSSRSIVNLLLIYLLGSIMEASTSFFQS